MVIEMPVLDNALLGCALAFTPLMVALTFGEPAMRALSRATRRDPAGGCRGRLDILLDSLRQDPEPERRGAAGPVLRPHRAAAARSAARSTRPRW